MALTRSLALLLPLLLPLLLLLLLLLAPNTSQSLAAAGNCSGRQFACGSLCLPTAKVCDGRNDCPMGEDEVRPMCHNRTCTVDEFACNRQGHCVPASARCNGVQDCGVGDSSDEANCRPSCPPGTHACTGQRNSPMCLNRTFVCDGFYDCADKTDEANCKPKCRAPDFKCGDLCLPPEARCNGSIECRDRSDEQHCETAACPFKTDFFCRISRACVSASFVCDDQKDCPLGEDEVCTTVHPVCNSPNYLTCKSGTHCVHKSLWCDGHKQCVDGSDEYDCPIKQTRHKPFSCPLGYHLCNGTVDHCVDLASACFSGRPACPHADTEAAAVCRRLRVANTPCNTNNGGCEQICNVVVMNNGSLGSNCSCRAGFAVSPTDARRCSDVDECRLFGSCPQACANTHGSFACSCDSGYSLHGNQCVANGRPVILYSTNHDIRSLDGPLLTGLTRPRLMVADAVRREILFVEANDALSSFDMDGNSTRRVATGVSADAVAYDWQRRLLFFASPGAGVGGSLGVVNVTSGRLARLRRLDCPHGLARHPRTGEIFVALWCGQRPGVWVLRPNASARPVVTGVGKPWQLALDLRQRPQRLYWTDADSHGVFSCALDGSDLRAHLRGGAGGRQLAAFEDRLFLTDTQGRHVVSVDKFNGGDIKEVAKAYKVMAIAVMHHIEQDSSLPAPGSCGSCAGHVCAASDSSVACLCSAGFHLFDGVCLNATDRAVAMSMKVAMMLKSATGDVNELPVGSVTLAVAVPLAVLVIVLAIAGAVALRRGAAPDMYFVNAACAQLDRHARLTNANSRTGLTDCEASSDSP